MKRLNSNLSNFDYLFMLICLCLFPVFPFQYHPYPMSYPVLAHGRVKEWVKDRLLSCSVQSLLSLHCYSSILLLFGLSFELCHCFIFK